MRPAAVKLPTQISDRPLEPLMVSPVAATLAPNEGSERKGKAAGSFTT